MGIDEGGTDVVGDNAHPDASVWCGSWADSPEVYSRPESAAARSMTGRTWSVSYMFSTSWRIVEHFHPQGR